MKFNYTLVRNTRIITCSNWKDELKVVNNTAGETYINKVLKFVDTREPTLVGDVNTLERVLTALCPPCMKEGDVNTLERVLTALRPPCMKEASRNGHNDYRSGRSRTPSKTRGEAFPTPFSSPQTGTTLPYIFSCTLPTSARAELLLKLESSECRNIQRKRR
jgi:hypothetical protein